MPNNALRTISEPQVLSRDRVIREWLVRFAELYRYQGQPTEITPSLVAIWSALLSDVEPGLLHKACERTANTCRFFPTPADIRGQIDQAAEKGLQLEAEHKWQELMAWVERWYHPDLGVLHDAPRLQPMIEHAGRAAGGFRLLATCSEEKLVWQKKEFIRDYTMINEMELVKHFLSDSESKNLLSSLTAAPQKDEVRELVVTTEVSPAHGDNRPNKEEVQTAMVALREWLNRPKPQGSPVTEDTEQKKRAELERFRRHLEEHPELQRESSPGNVKPVT